MEPCLQSTTAQPVSRVQYFQTLLARLEEDGRGRVARCADASNLIAGAARLHIFDEIDSPERKEKGEVWRDAMQAQLRRDVRDFKQPHGFEIQAVRVYCGGIGNGVNGSRYH
jgi:hypothetical protein